MSKTVDTLILDLLEWIGPGVRPYSEVMEAWKTSCPRLPVWEEATERGFVTTKHEAGRGTFVVVSHIGAEHLRKHRETIALEHIFFDLDGTLTDPRDGIVRSIQHALSKLGRKLPEECDLERFIGPPLASTFRTLLGAADDTLVEEAIAAYRERFAAVGIYENRVYPELPGALRILHHSGRRLYLLTVKPTVFAERILVHSGLREAFHAVYGSDLNDLSPDKTVLLARAMEAEKLPASRVGVVGDREDDVIAARRNGVAAVAVSWGYGSLEELENAGPRWLVHTAGEMLACLGAPVSRV